MPDFDVDGKKLKKKNWEFRDSNNVIFSNPSIFNFPFWNIMRFSPWKFGKIDAKGQPIWLSGCPKEDLFVDKKAKKAKNAFSFNS